MLYSYTCKTCGYTIRTTKKKKAKTTKKNHRQCDFCRNLEYVKIGKRYTGTITAVHDI